MSDAESYCIQEIFSPGLGDDPRAGPIRSIQKGKRMPASNGKVLLIPRLGHKKDTGMVVVVVKGGEII